MGFLQTTITELHTGDFTPTPAATIYLIDATANDLTVTFPVAAQAANSVYELRRIDATGHTVTLAGAADATTSPAIQDYVNGLASITLAANSGIALVSDGVNGWHSLSTNSGGGALDVGGTLQGTDPNTALLNLIGADSQAAPYVVIQRPSADYLGSTMIEGQTETSAQLWYADENGDVWASRDLLAARKVTVGGSLTAGANSTITGSLGVTSLNSSGAVDGASAAITGEVQAGSVRTTGTVAAGSVGVTAGVTVGTTLQAGDGSSTGIMANADGSLHLFDSSEPGTPDSGIVIWAASGVFHWKGPDGVVH